MLNALYEGRHRFFASFYAPSASNILYVFLSPGAQIKKVVLCVRVAMVWTVVYISAAVVLAVKYVNKGAFDIISHHHSRQFLVLHY